MNISSDYGDFCILPLPEQKLIESYQEAYRTQASFAHGSVVTFALSKTLPDIIAVWTDKEMEEFSAALWAVNALMDPDWGKKVTINVSKERFEDKRYGDCFVEAQYSRTGELRFLATIRLLPTGMRNWGQGNVSKGTFLGTCVHELGHIVYRSLDKTVQLKWEKVVAGFGNFGLPSRYAKKNPEENFCETLAALFLSKKDDVGVKGRIGALKELLPCGNPERDPTRKLICPV